MQTGGRRAPRIAFRRTQAHPSTGELDQALNPETSRTGEIQEHSYELMIRDGHNCFEEASGCTRAHIPHHEFEADDRATAREAAPALAVTQERKRATTIVSSTRSNFPRQTSQRPWRQQAELRVQNRKLTASRWQIVTLPHAPCGLRMWLCWCILRVAL